MRYRPAKSVPGVKRSAAGDGGGSGRYGPVASGSGIGNPGVITGSKNATTRIAHGVTSVSASPRREPRASRPSGKSRRTPLARAAGSPRFHVINRGHCRNALLLSQRRLGRRQPCDRHTEWGAAHVVHADFVAEVDAVRVAAMLAADADLQVLAGLGLSRLAAL